MFIAPDTVPVYLPPMSMQVVHEPGMVVSLKKLASAIDSTARIGCCMNVASDQAAAGQRLAAEAEDRARRPDAAGHARDGRRDVAGEQRAEAAEEERQAGHAARPAP